MPRRDGNESIVSLCQYVCKAVRERDVNRRRGGVLVSILPVIEKDYAVAVVKKEYNMMKTVVEGGSLCGTID
eukprot:scaffold4028_cov217-Alexandrium_tamarense.AAC.14